MSEAHIAKFAEIVVQDPEMYARLGLEQVSDEAGGRAFVSKAIKEAKAAGLEFTEAEGYEWMKEEVASESRGELSDTQLEAVAGGKGPAKGSIASHAVDNTRTADQDRNTFKRVLTAIPTMGLSEVPFFRGW